MLLKCLRDGKPLEEVDYSARDWEFIFFLISDTNNEHRAYWCKDCGSVWIREAREEAPYTREELETILMLRLEKLKEGRWIPFENYEVLKLFCKSKGWEPIHLDWPEYLYYKCQAHYMTMRQMETIVNILEAD
jgi:hypothetical protein